jgi:phosphoribosylaminoimidazolecarboxamide formyltransferase / IMP cyclohydrolase
VVKSNAIVLVRDRRTVGIGAGQMSRVDASRIAVMKAHDQDVDLAGRGGVRRVLPLPGWRGRRGGGGREAIIQPGGSVRDEEVIEAANEHGWPWCSPDRRVFRH